MCLRSIVVQLMVLWAIGSAADQSSSSCEDSCGNIAVHYPFGTSKGCYMEEQFLVTCDHASQPHKLYLENSTIEVTDISLTGQLRILSEIARDCYDNKQLRQLSNNNSTFSNKFPVSSTRNKFTAVGCDTYAMIQNDGYSTGCLSQCHDIGGVTNGSCSGTGCCRADIPKGVRSFDINLTSFYNHSRVWDFNPCSYGFIVEEGNYSFSSIDLRDFQNRTKTPVVLDWAIGNETCVKASENPTSYACKANNSNCYDFDNGPGYRCNCSEGYEGNPYRSNGCEDIDECIISNPCNMTCHNLPGTYNCSCPDSYEGDGTKNGTGCSLIAVSNNRLPLIIIALGLSIGLVALFLGSSWIYWMHRKRKLMKLREKFFQQNGGIMLQQQLSKHERSVETARIFTAEELKKATNNYDESGIIGQGGYGTVYRGVLTDNRVVAIKKSKISDQSQIEQFINEVIVLAQINHKNVVKLLGCCLETEVPLLVYEFITNGTLSNHIHDEFRASLLTWEKRLKISAETAGALAYLHSSTSTSIIHRDVKSTNILLDDNYNAKVADFGASRLVPQDHTQLATLVQGTFGYLDPEYFHSSQLTEKSDVYSFGVVLAELLTGKKALSFDRPENERNLATYFISAMKEDRLLHILEHRMVSDTKLEQITEVAKLAKRCLRLKADKRPIMKEVAMELDGLRMMKKHRREDVDLYPEETEQLLNQDAPSDGYYGVVGSSIGCSSCAGYDSTMDQMIVPLDDGR